MMKAINPKNQSLVNKAMQWLEKHNLANTLRDDADGSGDEKAYRVADRRCEHTYDRFLDIMEELPGNQRAAIYNSDLY